MTITAFTVIPDSVAVGAQVVFIPSTAKNLSESGNTGRKLLRPIKRNYMVAISPDDSDEMQAIVMAARGDRWPIAIKDYGAFEVTDEECQLDDLTGDYLMGRTWAPITGTLSYFERILVPESITVLHNGSPATTGSYHLADFGRIVFSPSISTGDTVSITGTYLKPIALLDPATANIFGSVGGVPQYQFTQMRFEELFEAELVDLLS
jgi:hypothetical protein